MIALAIGGGIILGVLIGAFLIIKAIGYAIMRGLNW